jgi:hypothetical protein
MLSGLLSQPSPVDFPNGLSSLPSQRPALGVPVKLLVGLVLLCLVPRAMMAARLGALAPDALLYVHLAQQSEHGHSPGSAADSAAEIQLSVYPMILAGLHRLGLPWDVGGKYWGVVISSLVVLPLFGWMRRQFDDRVAVAACFLYAMHMDLIAWSPETIRDPTFWFLFVLSIYLQWRAITEVRLGLFAVAGVTLILGILTRVEGLLLVIPLGLWSLTRWKVLDREHRGRLAVGLGLSLAVVPVIVVLANLAWAGAHGRWEMPRLLPLAVIRPWVQSMLESLGLAAHDPQLAAQRSVVALPLGETLRAFLPTVGRGFTVVGLFLPVGIWQWRRTWWRSDHRPLVYLSLLIFVGIWIELWAVGDTCTRYVFPIVLAGSGFSALGLLWTLERLTALCRRMRWSDGRAGHAAVGLAGVIVALGVASPILAHSHFRNAQADLGQWIDREFGPSPTMVGPNGIGPVVAYYAGGQCRSFSPAAPCDLVVAMVEEVRPDVVVLRPNSHMNWDCCQHVADIIAPLGWEQARPDGLPPGCEEVRILTRRRANGNGDGNGNGGGTGDFRMATRIARDE